MPSQEVSRSPRSATAVLTWVALSALLAISLIVIVNSIAFGRIPAQDLISGWSGSRFLTGATAVAILWWGLFGIAMQVWRDNRRLRLGTIASLPLVAGCLIPSILIYVSDYCNHYFYSWFVHLGQPKGFSLVLIILLATALLQIASLHAVRQGKPFSSSFIWMLQRWPPPAIVSLLAAIGLLQGSSYVDGFFPDFHVRYWPMADGWATGIPYVVADISRWPSGFMEGGLARFLLDLPAYPALLAVSFRLFGHNTVGGYMPTLIMNIVLMPLAYLMFNEVLRNRLFALLLAGTVFLFPSMRFYSLNWVIPDPLFFVGLLTSGWLLARAIHGDRHFVTWGIIGVAAAITALSRPEGIAYSLIYLAVLLTVSASLRHKLLASVLCLGPMAVFSLFMLWMFGTPWPQNWSSSLGINNPAENWLTFSNGLLHTMASSMRMAEPGIVAFVILFLTVSAASTLVALRINWRIAGLIAPAWANFALVMLVDPLVSGSNERWEFFRHVSYPLPLFALVSFIPVCCTLHRFKTTSVRLAATAIVASVLLLGINWEYKALLRPSLNYGDDSTNFLGSSRANFVDMVRKPQELPVLQFEQVEGRYVFVMHPNGIYGYVKEFQPYFESFDVVRTTAGTSYQVATGWLLLVSIVLATASMAAARLDYPPK